jgi:hypothetical protein
MEKGQIFFFDKMMYTDSGNLFNGGVQPNPIFSVFHCFQYQYNPRFLSGLYCVIRALAQRNRAEYAYSQYIST